MASESQLKHQHVHWDNGIITLSRAASSSFPVTPTSTPLWLTVTQALILRIVHFWIHKFRYLTLRAQPPTHLDLLQFSPHACPCNLLRFPDIDPYPFFPPITIFLFSLPSHLTCIPWSTISTFINYLYIMLTQQVHSWRKCTLLPMFQ